MCLCVCVCTKIVVPFITLFRIKSYRLFQRQRIQPKQEKKKNERYAAFKKRSRCPLQPSVAHDLHQ